MRKSVTYTAFVGFCLQWCIILICCFSSMKRQDNRYSIVDNHHNSLRIGRIQSIQVDSEGNLYVWINNCDLIRINSSTDSIEFFHYGYSSRFRHGFVIDNDRMLFYDGNIHIYNLSGQLLHEAGTAVIAFDDTKELACGKTRFIVKRNIIFDEVWQDIDNVEKCVYRRLAWDVRSQVLLSLFISIVCVIPLCKKLKSILENK